MQKQQTASSAAQSCKRKTVLETNKHNPKINDAQSGYGWLVHNTKARSLAEKLNSFSLKLRLRTAFRTG